MIAKDWQGETVVCIGGGPSLTGADVARVEGRSRVIVINNAFQIAPWADILYSCDGKWWGWHDGATGFAGERWTQDLAAAEHYNINYIEGRTGSGLSTDPSFIHTGKSSGYQAINLAYHKGARRVILLGYDMQADANGLSHWHGDHPDKVPGPYTDFIRCIGTIAEQGLIEIINCSRGTALDCFPRLPLEGIAWT